MSWFKRLSMPIVGMREPWRRYLVEGMLAIVATLLVTGFIYVLHLYPHARNITLVYLLVVILLAVRYGLYAAVIAALVASASFDFFLVPPLYTFQITQPEEYVALLLFLSTALFISVLSSRLRKRLSEAHRRLNVELEERAEEAKGREEEMRILYEVMRAMNGESDLGCQLDVIAEAVVKHFYCYGVRGCAILVADENGWLLRMGVPQSVDVGKLFADKEVFAAAMSVMKYGHSIIFHTESDFIHREHGGYVRRIFTGIGKKVAAKRRYIRMIPMNRVQEVVGSLLLLMEEDASLRQFCGEEEFGREHGWEMAQTELLQRFVESIVSVTGRATERVRLQRDKLEIELWKKLHEDIVSWISHGLRSPLTVIKGDVTSLLQEGAVWDEKEVLSALKGIEHAADRLDRFVDNLLDMSRIEGGVLRPKLVLYVIEELIHDTLEDMQAMLCGRVVKVEIAELPPVELDYIQIGHVLTNLIENAVRYTPVDGVIEIGTRMRGTQVVISVADRGPGIVAGDIEHIFEKFYRGNMGHLIERPAGTGLGLAVCKGLVKAHNGRIWVENREGKGAIFQFTLPLLQEEGRKNE